MRRSFTLTSFLIQDLFRSLAGILPLASTLAFGLIAFEYGMDQPQFTTVAGVGMGAICLATALVLASRANRATSFFFVARLHRRTELLVALLLGSLVITAVLSLIMALARTALTCRPSPRLPAGGPPQRTRRDPPGGNGREPASSSRLGGRSAGLRPASASLRAAWGRREDTLPLRSW